MKKYKSMKLNNYFVAILTALALFSCSDDIGDGQKGNPEQEIVYDATLSLAINGEGKITKASSAEKAETAKAFHQNSWSYINRLSVAVFAEGDNGVFSLVAFRDSIGDKYVRKEGEPIQDAMHTGNSVDQVREISVPAGQVKLIVMANVVIPENLRKTGTTLASYQDLELDWADENEINGNLSMSSGVLDYTLRPGHNYIGYNQSVGETSVDHDGVQIGGYEIAGKKIWLYRNVAWIQLEKITLRPSADFAGVDAIFRMDTFFVANVKTKSKLVFDTDGSVEISGDGQIFISGALGDETGSLKPDAQTTNDLFAYDCKNPVETLTALHNKYFYANYYYGFASGKVDGRTGEGVDGGGDLKPIQIQYPNDNSHYGGGPGTRIGIPFYVYENQSVDGLHTLLVVKGEYKYKPSKSKPWVVYENRYYAIVVNDEGAKFENTDEHKYVKKNNLYNISLTIAGPGSDKPFDRQATAHVAAQVTVADWNVINQDENVD